MAIYAIVCTDHNYAIGYQNQLLFHVPEDMARFRVLTTGQTVIMGRKTLESLPGGCPLPERKNFVVTKNPDSVRVPGVRCFPSPLDALRTAVEETEGDVWVIGGQDIFDALLEYCLSVHLTRLHRTAPQADRFFPIQTLKDWPAFLEGVFQDGDFLVYMNPCPKLFNN